MLWCSKLRHCVPQLVRLHGGCLDSSWDGGVHHSSQRKPMPVLQPKFPTSAYSPNLVEGVSVLKKSLSARSAVQESPKTRLKHYENGVSSP
jgi:hypothetical protein